MSITTDLSGAIRQMFRNNTYQSCWHNYRYQGIQNHTVRYVEIPINEDVFEIPVFAFQTFTHAIMNDSDSQAIAVMLNTLDKEPRYKTVDRYMRDVLIETYKDSRLVKLEVKQGNDILIYYGTHGAVFDKDFNPLAVCSYQIEKEDAVVINDGEQDKTINRYKFLRPILRVDPQVYLYKSTSMERFIVNKMINTCLEDGVYMPMSCDLDMHFDIPINHDTKSYNVKIEIDKCPFLVHQTATPSISTDNKHLLQLAIDHIEELIQ